MYLIYPINVNEKALKYCNYSPLMDISFEKLTVE